jgi:transposase
LDIIVGDARRRRNDDEKRAIVAETFMDGETVAKVARRHELKASMLLAWRKQYRELSTSSASPESTGSVLAVIVPPEPKKQRRPDAPAPKLIATQR